MSKKRDKEIRLEMGRREFLKTCTCAALSAGAFTSTLANLDVAQAALATSPTAYSEYRALVCIFLFGGNDAWNTIIPNDGTGYSDYSTARQNLAVPQGNLLALSPVTPITAPYTAYGLHPSMPELQTLFNQGSSPLAIVGNIGTLREPVTETTWDDNTALRPPNLFSHNSQTDLWQSIDPSASDGWAGRIEPLITAAANAAVTGSQQFNFNISLRGTNLMQTGATTLPYNISSNGVTTFTGLNTDNATNTRRLQAFNDLLTLAQTDIPLIQAYGAVQESARDTTTLLEAQLAGLGALTTTFPNSSLGRQLEMVTNMIRVNSAAAPGTPAAARRQIFYVGTGGFDTHGAQLTRHPGLLADLSACMGAFYNATVEMGLVDNITTFTNSEFGRTLTSNGDGSDHGWGGHAFVMGGSVGGGDFYGYNGSAGIMPVLQIDGPDDTRSGRMIPATPTDAMMATICRWLGVTGLTGGGNVGGGSDMDNAFPNLNGIGGAAGFAGPHDLGFML